MTGEMREPILWMLTYSKIPFTKVNVTQEQTFPSIFIDGAKTDFTAFIKKLGYRSKAR